MKVLVTFMYEEPMTIDKANIISMLHLAGYYVCTSLKEQCLEEMKAYSSR